MEKGGKFAGNLREICWKIKKQDRGGRHTSGDVNFAEQAKNPYPEENNIYKLMHSLN